METQKSAVEAPEIETLLRELLTARDLLTLSRWPFETSRWYELAGSVLRVIGGSGPAETALETLTRLGLLDIDDLVTVVEDDADAAASADLMKAVLTRLGFQPESAQRAVATIVEAANFLQDHYGGRVQVLLRRQGQVVLDNLMAELPLLSVDEESRRAILTHWLQRTLDLPIPVSSRGVRLAASAHHADIAELVDAADRLDINVAILDELLARYETEPVLSGMTENAS